MCWHYARHWFFYVARWSASVRHTSHKNDNLFRYFPLGNIRIFVTKFFMSDTFCSGYSGGLLRDQRKEMWALSHPCCRMMKSQQNRGRSGKAPIPMFSARPA